jgi:hypothetical protein
VLGFLPIVAGIGTSTRLSILFFGKFCFGSGGAGFRCNQKFSQWCSVQILLLGFLLMLGVWGVLLVNFVDPEEAIGSIVAIKGIPFVVLGVKVRSESIFWGDLVIWEPASEMGWQALPKVARLT